MAITIAANNCWCRCHQWIPRNYKHCLEIAYDGNCRWKDVLIDSCGKLIWTHRLIVLIIANWSMTQTHTHTKHPDSGNAYSECSLCTWILVHNQSITQKVVLLIIFSKFPTQKKKKWKNTKKNDFRSNVREEKKTKKIDTRFTCWFYIVTSDFVLRKEIVCSDSTSEYWTQQQKKSCVRFCFLRRFSTDDLNLIQLQIPSWIWNRKKRRDNRRIDTHRHRPYRNANFEIIIITGRRWVSCV